MERVVVAGATVVHGVGAVFAKGMEDPAEEVRGRLARLCVNGALRCNRPGQALRELGGLEALVPEGSVLWTHRRAWTAVSGDWVTWNVVVLCPSALGEEAWHGVRLRMKEAAQVRDACAFDSFGLRVAAPEQEGETLEGWVVDISGAGHGVTTGSVERIRALLAGWRSAGSGERGTELAKAT